MLPELDDRAKDIAFTQGLLEEWAKTQPPQISEYLKTLINGVDTYRSMWYDLKLEYEDLNSRYNTLSSSQFELMQQLQYMKDQETERLIEEQKEFWPSHEDNLERRPLVVPSRTNAGQPMAER